MNVNIVFSLEEKKIELNVMWVLKLGTQAQKIDITLRITTFVPKIYLQTQWEEIGYVSKYHNTPCSTLKMHYYKYIKQTLDAIYILSC